MNYRKLLLVGGLAAKLIAQELPSHEQLNRMSDPNGEFADVYAPTGPIELPRATARTPVPVEVAPAPTEIAKVKTSTRATTFNKQIAQLVEEMGDYGIQTTTEDLLYTIGVVVSEHNTITGQREVINTIRNSSLYDLCHDSPTFTYRSRGFLNPGAAAKFPERFKYTPEVIATNSDQIKLRVGREIADQYIEAASVRQASILMNGPVKDALYFNSMWFFMQGGETWRHDFITRREGHYFYTLDGPKNWDACYVREEAKKFKR